MPTIVEDGTLVLGANSYVTVLELEQYADAKGYTISGDADVLLFRAASYTESLRASLVGRQLTKLQKMAWPRSGAVIDGFQVADTEIPEVLKTLQKETALSIDEGSDPMATVSRATKREKVGVIEVTYMDNSTDSPRIRALTILANQLVGRTATGGQLFNVSRG